MFVVYFVVFGFGDGVMVLVFNILILICVDFLRVVLLFGYFLLIVFVMLLVGFLIVGGLIVLFLGFFLKEMRIVEYYVLNILYGKLKKCCILVWGRGGDICVRLLFLYF